MKKLDLLLSQYGESHENAINKLIHWFCVPLIFISLYGMLRLVVFNSDYPQILNLGTVILIAALIYYIRLSVPMFFGFVVWSGFVWWLNETLLNNLGSTNFIKLIIGIFVSAWIVQFIGHKIEGKKPSFLKDVQFLLIGPAWLLHFIYKKYNISY